jgi:hypothetical protein
LVALANIMRLSFDERPYAALSSAVEMTNM